MLIKNALMRMRKALIVALFLPFPVATWEDDAVLYFISRVNPIIEAYARPDAVTWAERGAGLTFDIFSIRFR
ncbi:hypothetical protein Q9L42_005565 [Methylomarinum sp. Ch1-1]|uniref:Uncharacterized protein n=1 Tax=Methylomarinum roseum TaxID=3067653 RepID=A0AAU7NYE9_9GAMM